MQTSRADELAVKPADARAGRVLVGAGLMTLAVGAMIGIGLGLQLGFFAGILGETLLAVGAFTVSRREPGAPAAWYAVGGASAALATLGLVRFIMPDEFIHQVDHAVLSVLAVSIVAAFFEEAYGVRKVIPTWVPYVALVGGVGDFYHGVMTAFAIPGETGIYELASAFPLAVAAFAYGFVEG